MTYDTELAALESKFPDTVVFVPAVSLPNEERNSQWQGAKGRVNTITEEYMSKFDLTKDDTMVYACGHPGMIEDVKARFVTAGWKFKEERFWKE